MAWDHADNATTTLRQMCMGSTDVPQGVPPKVVHRHKHHADLAPVSHQLGGVEWLETT
jgi:hypothetical protein